MAVATETKEKSVQIGFSINPKFILIAVCIIAVLGVAGVATWQVISHNNAHKAEMNALTNAFYTEYGKDALPQNMVNPKSYYVLLWKDVNGNQNISANFGGKWVLLSSTLPATTPETNPTPTP
jgi:ABC-type bacteriocin/lantibiotic exporter with double-glycine peptidase domain